MSGIGRNRSLDGPNRANISARPYGLGDLKEWNARNWLTEAGMNYRSDAHSQPSRIRWKRHGRPEESVWLFCLHKRKLLAFEPVRCEVARRFAPPRREFAVRRFPLRAHRGLDPSCLQTATPGLINSVMRSLLWFDSDLRSLHIPRLVAACDDGLVTRASVLALPPICSSPRRSCKRGCPVLYHA
jgi:hypothetical protein